MRPKLGRKVLGVFGVDAEFHGEAPVADVLLLVLQGQAVGDADLLLDDVDAGDVLGDRVLHLEAGVHLHEVELVVMVQQELHRAGVLVAHRLGGAHRQLADVFALGFGQLGRGGDLDELLVAALDGAVPLVEVDAVAVAVADDLHLDVLGIDHALLDEHLGLAEGLGGLGDHPLVVLDQFVVGVAAPDAAAAAAVGGLEHDRIADLLRPA
jgi:hypothetical protein